jgi:hypothetical protein
MPEADPHNFTVLGTHALQRGIEAPGGHDYPPQMKGLRTLGRVTAEQFGDIVVGTRGGTPPCVATSRR